MLALTPTDRTEISGTCADGHCGAWEANARLRVQRGPFAMMRVGALLVRAGEVR